MGTGRKGDNVCVTAPLNPFHNSNSSGGSGALAFWRVISMFKAEYLNWAPPNWNKGWKLENAQALRQYVSNSTSPQNKSQDTATTRNITLKVSSDKIKRETIQSDEHGNFDVFVFRIPSPTWIPMGMVTQESLRETVELAHQLFGFRVAIFVSSHYVNQAPQGRDKRDETYHSRKSIRQTNKELFDFSRNWTENHGQDRTNGGVHSIYVLDYGRLNDELLEWNAHLLGFDTESDSAFMEDKIPFITKSKKQIYKSVAHVCGEKVPNNSIDCIGNAITADGVHMCMNIVGPRLAAGLACQLQCVHSPSDEWACAKACNDQYMSTK